MLYKPGDEVLSALGFVIKTTAFYTLALVSLLKGTPPARFRWNTFRLLERNLPRVRFLRIDLREYLFINYTIIISTSVSKWIISVWVFIITHECWNTSFAKQRVILFVSKHIFNGLLLFSFFHCHFLKFKTSSNGDH